MGRGAQAPLAPHEKALAMFLLWWLGTFGLAFGGFALVGWHERRAAYRRRVRERIGLAWRRP